MIDKCKALLKKYEEIITYLVIGVLTTLVCWITCWLFEVTLFNPQIVWQNAVINTLGWATSVVFGYVTNRKFVFKSTNPKIMKEFINFSGSRISTLILDNVIMYVTANLIGMNWWIAKIFISSVLVMIINYVFSKKFVFKKDKTATESIS